MDQIKIGAFLKQLRNEKGLTQGQLAEQLNVSNRSVSRWETGNNLPDISLLVELSDYYEVDIREIINGERKSEIMKEPEKEVIEKVAEYVDEKKKSELENFAIFTELLIVIGIVISLTLSKFVADSVPELIITLVCGWFVWGYGLILRVKLKKQIASMK